eukprot:8736395-Alexandrium_andersonii.AAC.1
MASPLPGPWTSCSPRPEIEADRCCGRFAESQSFVAQVRGLGRAVRGARSPCIVARQSQGRLQC